MANKLPVLVWTVCVLAIISNGECASRQRRNVFQFGTMIDCVSGGYSLQYLSYGCYCGLGGSGFAVDATDRCCRNHDQCYRNLKAAGTCTGSLDLYNVLINYTKSNCGSNNPQITCLPSTHSQRACADGLCRCDREAAFCFRRNSNSFSYQYINYNKGRYC